MAWIGLPLLQALADGPLLTRELAQATGISADRVGRACRCLRARGLIVTSEGVHQLTESGREAVASGEEITCGPRKGDVRRDGSLRARAWRAMRIKERFSLDDLLTLLCDGTERTAASNLRDYLHALERAGYLTPLRRRQTPVRRWWLAQDTGPLAPSWNKLTRTLSDPNTGDVFAIPAENRHA